MVATEFAGRHIGEHWCCWWLVLSQQDAPAPKIHRTLCHFRHKNHTIVNMTFPYWKLVLFWYQLLTIFQKPCCKFCQNSKDKNNSNKLSCSYDLYFGITSFETQGRLRRYGHLLKEGWQRLIEKCTTSVPEWGTKKQEDLGKPGRRLWTDTC